jgi:hypothetical protein
VPCIVTQNAFCAKITLRAFEFLIEFLNDQSRKLFCYRLIEVDLQHQEHGEFTLDSSSILMNLANESSCAQLPRNACHLS